MSSTVMVSHWPRWVLVVPFEVLARGRLELEGDHGRAELIEFDARGLQVRPAQHDIIRIGDEDLVIRVGAGTRVDDQKLSGFAEEGDGVVERVCAFLRRRVAVRVRTAKAGKLHDEPGVALDLDHRLGDAQRVHAVLDDLPHGLHGIRVHLLVGRGVRLEAHVQSALEIQSLPKLQVREIAGADLHRKSRRVRNHDVERQPKDDRNERQHRLVTTAHVRASERGFATWRR